MEYMYFNFFFLLMIFSYNFVNVWSESQYQNRQGRTIRGLQHPAFPMMMGSPMAFPGNSMQSSYMSGSQADCITEDIVCPAWCLMEDEWGCKYCPCGPANGMSPPIVSNHKPAEMKHENNHDCIGTILCMLSCKEGYKLGSRDNESDCQSCTCVKKNETKTSDEKTTTGMNNSNSNSTDSSGSCTWPLCMNGQRPNTGPGTGAAMTSLPIGGVEGGGSLPGVDCLGPSCSAKNANRACMYTLYSTGAASCFGMRLIGNAIPTPKSSTLATKHPPPQARPPTQKTLLMVAPTKPPRRLYLVPVPTEAPTRHCATLEYCMNNCHHGFQVENSREECPYCDCILPLTPPTTTTKKPDFIAVMRVCPDAVHCMKSCTQGYTLTSSHTEACPICTCNREPKVLLLCERPLSCPKGCTVGYRGDEIGCPTCKCVAPSETRLRIEVQTTIIDSALTCNPEFSCVDKCSLGYRTGDNGCPTCVCLEPATDYYQRTDAVTQIPSPVIVQPSRLNCIGPECSAIHAVPPQLLLRCEQPFSCPYGCTVGYKCDREGCPICSCIAPSETTNKVNVQTIVVQKTLTCGAKFSCPRRCAFGFKTGSDGCPSCICLEPVTVHINNGQYQGHSHQPIVAPIVRATEAPVVHQVHMVPETVTQMSLPEVLAPSGIGCLSPSCPSAHQLGQNGNIFLSAMDHNQHTSQSGNVISPAHSSHKPSSTGIQTETVVTHPADIKKPGQSTGSRPKLVIGKPNNFEVIQHIQGSTASPDTSTAKSAMEACPETVRCMVGCVGTYDLTQRDDHICPDCKCNHDASGCIGPACSAPGFNKLIEEKSTPSPGECVAILHCVMTCDFGYDIGEYSSDGCPTCTCVEL